MLLLENVSVEVANKVVLKNINMEIKSGELHVLFGPNGSGKSTLLATIMGLRNYNVIEGRIYFKGRDITDLPPNERANLGIGIMLQRPPTLRGVKTKDIVSICGKEKVKPEELAKMLDLEEFLDRDINSGFSGGEIKRSELLQLLAQDPDLVLLDEPESGVDLENIALIGKAINRLLQRETPVSRDVSASPKEIRERRQKSGLIITHTGYILDYVAADIGHVLYDGHLSCSGNPIELLRCIRQMGYEECIQCAV